MKICTDPSVLKVIYFLKIIVIIIKIAVPIILVVLAMIDLFKAVIASDDKEKKKAVKLLIKRVIYSLLIFFVPTIVNTLMITIGNIGESENFTDCLENATGDCIDQLENGYSRCYSKDEYSCYYCQSSDKYLWRSGSPSENCPGGIGWSKKTNIEEKNCK